MNQLVLLLSQHIQYLGVHLELRTRETDLLFERINIDGKEELWIFKIDY